MAQACIVRPASSLQEAHGIYWPLMEELGWNRSIGDTKTHYISTGESGFLIVAPKENPDEVQGLVVPFTYANGTGWVGFFCINEPCRGLGWGRVLFQAGLDHFKSKDVAVVGLDAVAAQVNTYRRRGFVPTDRVRLMQRDSLLTAPLEGGLAHTGKDEELVDLATVPERVLVASDLAHTGLERSMLWSKEALLDRDDVFGFAIVKEGKTEVLEGWIVVRGCEKGFRVGPLYAASPELAHVLLVTAMKRVEDRSGTLSAEVWAENEKAGEVFGNAGWTDGGVEYQRMWLNGVRPEAQGPGGRAEREMWAIFDAGEG